MEGGGRERERERKRAGGLKQSVMLLRYTFSLIVSLVKQQAEYIEEHTSLNVGQYTGDKKVGKWTKERWDAEFKKSHVLVMIVQVFLDLLLQGQIQFKQINLLVFDECHHAVKEHGYVQIMRRYKDSCDVLEPTRFLGLTASIIPSKCRPGVLTQKIEELEWTLCSRAQTTRDLFEVAKYATNPTEVCKSFTPSSEDRDVCRLRKQLEEILYFLENFPRKLMESKIYETVKLNFEDCLHVLTSLGIWCAHQYSCRALKEIASDISECSGMFVSKEEEMLIHLGHTKMKLFKIDTSSLACTVGNRIHMTDKVHQLLLHLRDSAGVSHKMAKSPLAQGRREGRKSIEKLRGIIFTERRTTAMLLKDLLQQESTEHPDLQHISCDCVVGHNESKTGTYVRREARMNTKKVEKVLSQFKQGAINLLVATSVVEEGVDVPKCNLVVRFDFPQNLRSYVQSKGRARAKESQYILLIPKDEESRLIPQLWEYNLLVKELETVCHGRHVADDEEIMNQLKDKVEPYRKSKAVATINSSMNLVHKYVILLPLADQIADEVV